MEPPIIRKKRTRIVAERRNAKAAGIPKAQIPDPILNPSREVKGTTAERLRAAGKTLVLRRQMATLDIPEHRTRIQYRRMYLKTYKKSTLL